MILTIHVLITISGQIMSSPHLSDIEIGELKQSEDIEMPLPISQNGMKIKVTLDLKKVSFRIIYL